MCGITEAICRILHAMLAWVAEEFFQHLSWRQHGRLDVSIMQLLMQALRLRRMLKHAACALTAMRPTCHLSQGHC